MKRIKLYKCPRCGAHGLEHLFDYSHCVNCLFVEEHVEDLEKLTYDSF